MNNKEHVFIFGRAGAIAIAAWLNQILDFRKKNGEWREMERQVKAVILGWALCV